MKNFKKRLKRNNDAVLALHSPQGIDGGLLVSANKIITVWDLMKRKKKTKVELKRPSDEHLQNFTEGSLTNYVEDHVLNSEKALANQREMKSPCTFCFQAENIYTGYEDGLIVCYLMPEGNISNLLVGHTNRVNCLAVTDNDQLFSGSNDCTIR